MRGIQRRALGKSAEQLDDLGANESLAPLDLGRRAHRGDARIALGPVISRDRRQIAVDYRRFLRACGHQQAQGKQRPGVPIC